MNRLYLTVLLLTLAAGTAAQTVAISTLGSLELEFAKALPVDEYPGQAVGAKVSYRRGEAFNVPSPGRVQQIEYLVEPGAMMFEGQPFAVLRGPEMHHFEMSYQGSQALAEGAERRFKSNQALYARKAISESQWLEISEQYYALALEYEHMRHFFELVVSGDDDPDALSMTAPIAGIIDYSSADLGVEEGDSIAQFVPPGAVRLKLALPNSIGAEVASVRAGECRLAIERVSTITAGFFVQAWTQPLPESCPLLLGQQLLAIPMVTAKGSYLIPRSAVFQLAHENFVLVRNGDALNTVAVTLLGSEGDDYVLLADADLGGAEILVASVSAVQGILLGLGGE
jgi:hypothetical protein